MKNTSIAINEAKENYIEEIRKEYDSDYDILFIPNDLAKQYLTYTSMDQDLKLCLEYISLIEKEKTTRANSALSSLYIQALNISYITLYARCFMDAEAGITSLNENHHFKRNAELRETHVYLMNLRHRFIAHRIENENENRVAFVVSKKDEGLKKYKMVSRTNKRFQFGDEKLVQVKKLIQDVLSKVNEKIQATSIITKAEFLKSIANTDK